MKVIIFIVAAHFICLLSFNNASAQSNVNTWQGTVNTDWANSSNWSKNVVPTVTDSVVIPVSTNYPTITSTSSFSVKSITIDSSAMLTVMGSVTTEKGIFNKGDISGSGNIYGDVFNKLGSSLTPGGKNKIGILTIKGSLIDTLGSKIYIESAGTNLEGLPDGNDALYLYGYSYLSPKDTVVISFINGYTITNSATFTFLVAIDSTTSPIKNHIPLVGGGRYSIKYPIGYYGSSVETLLFTPISISVSLQKILPLQLLNFCTKQLSNQMTLQWQTENEVNTSYFTIERSLDGVNFTDIGKVIAKGSGSYFFTDNSPSIATQKAPIFYRLKMVDNDGSFTYSVTIHNKLQSANNYLSVFPNPVTDNVMVQLQLDNNVFVTLQIIDYNGKVLIQQSCSSSKIAYPFAVNISKLAKGTYTIAIKGDGILFYKQFVKQ